MNNDSEVFVLKQCFLGGTFALYSLISRYIKVSMIPNQQDEDAKVSNYRLESASNRLKRAEWIKEKLENNNTAKLALFLVTILGTSMVIGDGVLTPCISGTHFISLLLLDQTIPKSMIENIINEKLANSRLDERLTSYFVPQLYLQLMESRRKHLLLIIVSAIS